jgi:hypothetical protein
MISARQSEPAEIKLTGSVRKELRGSLSTEYHRNENNEELVGSVFAG